MMTFDTQVLRSVFRKMSPLLFTVAAFLLLYLIPALPHQAYATDQECLDLNIDNMPSKCTSFIDANGNILPDAKYLKCVDSVTCDPDIPGDPDKKTSKRCCIIPVPGSYGGMCLDPKDTRKNLGVGGVGGSQFMSMQQTNCDTNPDALSPARHLVAVVPPKQVGVEQSISEWYNDRAEGDWAVWTLLVPPTDYSSQADLPVLEDIVQVANKPIGKDWTKFGTTWFYQVDPNTQERRYFLRTQGIIPEWALYIHGYKVSNGFNLYPVDPREAFGDSIDRVGCRVANAFKRVGNAILSPMIRWTTSSENMPDIGFLCGKGIPQFENPTKIGFNLDGTIKDFVQAECHCVDANSGPSIAAVLLCTRYVAGMSDAYSPWRLLIPVPTNGNSGGRFFGLLYGGTSPTDTLEQFNREVRRDIREFFASNSEVPQWITNILSTQYLKGDPNFMARFFKGEDNPDAGTIIGDAAKLSAFKNNTFVQQYIGCLSCAKWGGFPTAIGCLPMDRVDRFLAEGVLGFGITIGGTFSVLCIIFGAIQFQLSEGESAKVQKAQKLITQCIIGLLIIIFSIFLLRFVGVDLLRIYGLG